MSDIKDRAIAWLLSGDTGISSETMLLLGHANARQTEVYLRKTKVPLVQGPTMKGVK